MTIAIPEVEAYACTSAQSTIEPMAINRANARHSALIVESIRNYVIRHCLTSYRLGRLELAMRAAAATANVRLARLEDLDDRRPASRAK